MIASQLSGHCDVIRNRLWRYQQNENRASETRGRCIKLVMFIVIYGFVITGDPLHSRAACTQPCNVNTHSRAHCSPRARLCEQWGHGCVNNGARLCASARLCRGSPVLCRVRNEIMYVLSWRTVSALTEVLFLLSIPPLLRNSGEKHQNNPSRERWNG